MLAAMKPLARRLRVNLSGSTPMPLLNRARLALSAGRLIVTAFMPILLVMTTPFSPTLAQAEPHEATLKLLKQEKFTDALQFVQAYLIDHPNDPQMKFWLALLLNKKGSTQESLALYREITQQYPELAEPHNNLGMLLAQQGELEEAKLEFEMALREQPDMAFAMENLSQVYLLLTEQTLKKALALNPQSRTLAAKLQIVEAFIKGQIPLNTPTLEVQKAH
jgi:tetratricopeptide (TPR) repeat protein